jgi:hypothetical protein
VPTSSFMGDGPVVRRVEGDEGVDRTVPEEGEWEETEVTEVRGGVDRTVPEEEGREETEVTEVGGGVDRTVPEEEEWEEPEILEEGEEVDRTVPEEEEWEEPEVTEEGEEVDRTVPEEEEWEEPEILEEGEEVDRAVPEGGSGADGDADGTWSSVGQDGASPSSFAFSSDRRRSRRLTALLADIQACNIPSSSTPVLRRNELGLLGL